MSIITLTTDLGDRDHYTASLKGGLLRLCPGAILVDITHRIDPFNIPGAAFILKSTFREFPEGSIHLIGVDPEGGNRQRVVVMLLEGHYFVAPDNGVLSLIQERNDALFREVDRGQFQVAKGAPSFLVKNLLVPAVAALANGAEWESLGEETEIRQSLWGAPTYTGNSLRGTILYIDHFGNAFTNIHKEEFLHRKEDRSFQIFIRNLRLQRIVTSYADVSRGEALAIFADNQHLEIGLREGSAAQLLGLKVQDMLTIEFYA